MTKIEAERTGRELRSKLKTKGWEVDVSCPDGDWGYVLTNGPLKLFPGVDGKFGCSVGEQNGPLGLLGMWSWSNGGRYKDPNKAVEGELSKAISIVNHQSNLLHDVEMRLLGK